jgi:hypothetical protein
MAAAAGQPGPPERVKSAAMDEELSAEAPEHEPVPLDAGRQVTEKAAAGVVS